MTTDEDERRMTESAGGAGMTCQAFLEVAEAFALGLLDEAEQDHCARHLAESARHAGCVDTVIETQLVTARLTAMLPGQPLPPRAWQAIEARLGEVPTEAARGRRLWELADWLVMATVVGLYLYGAPVSTPRPRAVEGEPPARRPGQVLPTVTR